jgi:hypothetical protein
MSRQNLMRSGIGVAARGAVRSILLVSKRPRPKFALLRPTQLTHVRHAHAHRPRAAMESSRFSCPPRPTLPPCSTWPTPL